jgi:hypothetical protein
MSKTRQEMVVGGGGGDKCWGCGGDVLHFWGVVTDADKWRDEEEIESRGR